MNRPRIDGEHDGEELMRAVRALPAASAGAGFHAAVLRRAAAATVRRRLRRRRALSLAALAGAAAVAFGAWTLEASRDHAARRAALVDEHRRLESELEELRGLAGRRTLLQLGGDASTDLVLDLSTLPAGVAAGPTAQPTRSPG